MKLEIEKVLVLSTAHVSKETDTYIEDNEVPYMKSEYGYLITVNYDGHDWPSDLKAVADFAASKKCRYFILDRDGETISELPTFDW